MRISKWPWTHFWRHYLELTARFSSQGEMPECDLVLRIGASMSVFVNIFATLIGRASAKLLDMKEASTIIARFGNNYCL